MLECLSLAIEPVRAVRSTYRLSFFNNLEEVSNLDSGSVFEMDVKTIRVVIVSMYLKMIRTLCLTQLEYGTTRELNL